RRADIVARLGYFRRRLLPRCLDRLGDSEIGDDRRAFAEQNVLGLDVAVDDSLPVGVGESGGDIAENGQALPEGNRTLPDPLSQGLPAHERHREVRISARGLTGGEHWHDVRL